MPGYKPAPKKRKPKPKVSTQTPIFGSIEDGDAEEFAECLSQTPECLKEVNKNGWTPLHQAAFSGQLAMLNTLLEKGLDVNAVCKDGDTPVHYAACQGERDKASRRSRRRARISRLRTTTARLRTRWRTRA